MRRRRHPPASLVCLHGFSTTVLLHSGDDAFVTVFVCKRAENAKILQSRSSRARREKGEWDLSEKFVNKYHVLVHTENAKR